MDSSDSRHQRKGLNLKEGPLPRSREFRIAELDRRLEREPESFEARYERAGLLREQGLIEQAKRDYLELIRRKPSDFGVLNDFGTLALKAGYRSAAHSLFTEAVRHHPDNPTGLVNLANLLLLSGEHEKARIHFEAALRIDPDHVHAHRGMGNLLADLGDDAGARWHRDRGFKNDFIATLPYRGQRAPVRVLLLISAAGGNTPTASFLDDNIFQTTVLACEYYNGKIPLPPHDVVFNSIGDADICAEGLEAARRILACTARPVVNHPCAVLKSGRAANVERLRDLPGVIVPRIAKAPRGLLASPDKAASTVASSGFSFPLLVRAPGFHTGLHFVRAGIAQQLADAVGHFPGDEVWLIEYLDARDSEGMFRKFRVMIVDRKLYPLHLAISPNWKVHYFTADMAASANNRAKEAPFLDDMAGVIGPRGIAALERIAAIVNLDYGGIDFAVNSQGDILFFEANATMVMIPLLPDEKWAYRRPAFDAVFTAVRAMLMDRAGASTQEVTSISASRRA
jgi:Tetratricopeptide repeat